jgi:hypothetical protein
MKLSPGREGRPGDRGLIAERSVSGGVPPAGSPSGGRTGGGDPRPHRFGLPPLNEVDLGDQNADAKFAGVSPSRMSISGVRTKFRPVGVSRP